MKTYIAAIATLSVACLFSSNAARADSSFPDRIESQVFQTTGSHQVIAKHAAICIAQVVRPGFTTASVVAAADPDAGIVVANNEFVYSALSFLPAQVRARTTITFQAKDGGFKIVHTNIEQYNEQHGSTAKAWDRITMGGDAAKKAIDAVSQSIARCVQQAPDTW